MKKIFCILFVLVSFEKNLQAQTLHTIDSLEKIKQACLNEGYHQNRCTGEFKWQMDSLVKLACQKLYAKGDATAKVALQKDQLDWIEKQKRNDQKIDSFYNQKKVKEELEGLAGMIIFGEKTDFIRDRARYLIKKLNSH